MIQDNTTFIEFKRERDLGAIITDTFKFIRDNWKDYFLTLLKIVGPVMALALLAMIGYFFAISDLVQGISNNPSDPFAFLSGFLPWFLIIITVFVFLYTLMSMSSLYFIKSYMNNNGKASYEEVRGNVLKNFWKFLGLGFLVTIVVIIGTVMCYLPGIYLWVILSLATSIMVFEGRSVGDTFSHAFTLIKGQWWNTFGVILVVGLLISVLGQAFSIPTIIYQFMKMATISEEDPTQIFSLFKDPIYLILNLISYAFQFILYSIPMISGVFIYYDLNEQKNLTGTMEKIDNIGGYQQ
jgi:hypothetical protein